jgi:sortase A
VKNKKGNIFITIGLLLIAAALLLTIKNVCENAKAKSASDEVLDSLVSEIEDDKDNSINNNTIDSQPLYKTNPDMDMPTVNVNGNGYIGVLKIPTLGLALPIKGDFSYKALKSAPCRYKGSVYTDDMVIAGHNFSSHFGNLKKLKLDDEVTFTDGDGNVFEYVVSDVIQLDGRDVDGMLDGEWDMTLFTCTLSGKSRVTVRLDRKDKVW